MARILSGAMGPVSGKVGKIVGATWKGIPYVRSLPEQKRKKTSTPAQAATRARFAVTTRFLSSMRDLLELGFRDHAVQMTGTNAAISYNMKHAITGDYPDFSIVHSKALVCRGSLPNADSASAAMDNQQIIRFSWNQTMLTGKASPHDQAIMIAWSPDYNFTVFDMGPERQSGEGQLTITSYVNQDSFHTWLSFMSEDEQDVANSIYCGRVVVSDKL